MALRSRKPTSPGRRFQTVSDFHELTRSRPERSLLAPKPKTGGRNVNGRKTSRHRGGGHKQQYRIVDFRRNKDGVPAKVAHIEYDPNRTCRIALLHYLDGEKRYILAPHGLDGRRHGPVGPRCGHPRRQCAADALHPDRLGRPQRRAAPRRRGQDGPERGHERPAGREGRRVRHAAPPLDRDAARPDRLSGDARGRGQLRARADQDRQGRPQPLEGRSAPRRAASR